METNLTSMNIAETLTCAKTLWDYHYRVDTPKQNTNSLILGLGSYDLRVADFCAELYLDKYAQKIIFSGKSGNWTDGRWNKTEAEIFAERAVSQGVPRDDIILEKEATNIGENIAFSRKLIEQFNFEQIILVTKPNTTRRAYATFMASWPEAGDKLCLSAPSVTFNTLAENQTTRDLFNELVGDIQRVLVYPNKGFQIHQDVPESVMNAYLKLKNDGFTAHCLNNANEYG